MDELLNLNRAKNKDREAFEKIINKYSKKLYVIAKSKVGSDEDAKDIVQNTLIQAYLSIHKLKDLSKFNAWITKILINNCKKLYKSKKIKLVSYDKIEENNSYFKTEEDISNLNENQSFYDLISFLEEKDRLIITMYYLNEYTTKDISEILKINESTLRSRISKIKEKIRKEIE